MVKSAPTKKQPVGKKKFGFSAGLGVKTPWGQVGSAWDSDSGLSFGLGRTGMPVAVTPFPRSSPGLTDIQNIRLEYDANSVYVSAGAAGVTNGVYLTNASVARCVTSAVPIAPGDQGLLPVGALYCNDLFKHFTRIRYHRIRVQYMPDVSATTAEMTIYLAPLRGGAMALTTPTMGAGTPAVPFSITDIQSMKGNVGGAHWSAPCLDLTSYIAGGSGPKQNEFDMSMSPAANGEAVVGIPCMFAFAGNSTQVSYQNTIIGRLRVSVVVDLLDFVGNFNPGAVTCRACGSQLKKLCAPRTTLQTDEKVESKSASALPGRQEISISDSRGRFASHVEDNYVAVEPTTPLSKGPKALHEDLSKPSLVRKI